MALTAVLRLRRRLHRLAHRRATLAGIGVTVLVALLLGPLTSRETAWICGWDAGVLAYGAVIATTLRGLSAEQLRRRAIFYDQGRWAVLGVSVFAAFASVIAIIVEIAQAKGTPAAPWSVALGLTTVLLSWCFVHTAFAVHYAHDWWRNGHGLMFPHNGSPTYSEFLYHSFTVATNLAVSDVQTQTPSMRLLVGIHSVVAWVFNTAIVALGVGMVGSLMS